MMARIGVMKALNRHVERVFNLDRKETHGGKRKLKGDLLLFLSMSTPPNRSAIDHPMDEGELSTDRPPDYLR
jgi:hypothetical protein